MDQTVEQPWYEVARTRLLFEKEKTSAWDLAVELGVNLATLYAILNGRNAIGPQTLEKIRNTRPDLLEGLLDGNGAN